MLGPLFYHLRSLNRDAINTRKGDIRHAQHPTSGLHSIFISFYYLFPVGLLARVLSRQQVEFTSTQRPRGFHRAATGDPRSVRQN